MLNKSPLLFCFYFLTIQCLHSQTIAVETLSDSAFSHLRYNFLDNQRVGDSIFIIVQVLDENDNFITGMANPKKKKPYFTALEDSAKKTICKDFTVTEATEDKSPVQFNFSLVLDYSGSMEQNYKTMQIAAQQFMSSLENSYFTRVNFDHLLDVVEPLPTLRPKSVYSDVYSRYGGGTALYAAADQGIETLKNAPGSRFVILFTDGLERSSGGVFGRAASPSQLVINARLANTAIYVLGFDIGTYPEMSEICEFTGGKYYPVDNVLDLAITFDRLRNTTFAHFYLIRAKCNETPTTLGIANPDGATKKGVPITKGKVGTPNPVYSIQVADFQFPVGDANLRLRDNKMIKSLAERVVELLKNDPSLKIEIRGHASPDGEEKANTKLSFRRAKAVYDPIVELILNMDADAMMTLNRITFKGLGETEPLYPVSSSHNPENRRVEIKAVH